MGNTTFNPSAPDDEFISEAQSAALLAQAAEQAAVLAQAAAEQALADTLAALAAQILDDHADVTSAGAINGDGIFFDGAAWVARAATLDDLGDVVAPAPDMDDVLQYDGSNWVNAPLAVLSGFLPLTGGVLTGTLELDGPPVDPLDAATKSYVDQQVGAATPYDIGVYFDGNPGADESLLKFVSVRTFTLFQNLTNSRAVADVAATGPYVVGILRNGVLVGTINWAAAATDATFVLAADAVFNQGDTLDLVAPISPDATIADLQITLIGNL